MKRSRLYHVAFLFVLFANNLFAQNIKWNSSPQTGFVFQITNNEAQKLLTKSSPDTIINALLHTEIDTFNVTRGWNNRPTKGHFIIAKIIENKLYCEYTSVFPYQVLLLKEYNALSLQVLDLEGNVRDNAKVKLKGRRISFDKDSKTYRIENEWFRGSARIVTVELDGFRSVFNIEKHEVPDWSNDYHYNDDEGPDFYSYMITDKNKYKPGERVRFKSYALSGSRTPIRRDLEIWLAISGRAVKLGTVSPHRPGSFAGEFSLHDSLKLTLDQFYNLQLREKSGRVVANCNFKYEDYELHGNKLQVDIETSTQFHPAANHVKIKASNENGLILKDAKAYVVVITDNIRETFEPLVVLPDTLMFKEIQLDADNETSIDIPSSIFKKSNTSYYVHVSVLNSQNQRMERTVSASHYFSRYELTASYSNDSIIYRMFDNGLPMRIAANLHRNGALNGTEVILPHKEKINPATSDIRIETNLVSRHFRMGDMLPKIEFAGGIQKDSFNIAIYNPQQIQVSWYVYQGSILLEKGFGSELDFKSKIEDRTQTYYVELLYSFGGSDHIKSKEFEFRERALDITLNIPDKVYPGQKVEAEIAVIDGEGNPVSGVDLTALATTAKLNYYLPDLPYYGSTSYGRSDKATYTKHDVNKRSAILQLDYKRWARRARLDTMKYYQFTYPGSDFFYYQSDIADSTQFAAYVMKDGAAKQVYVIEVDRVPVYYSWTGQPKSYSFYVRPEKLKEVTLRLHDRVLIFDSLCFDAGKKTIFSIDLDHLPKGVRVHNIAPEFVKVSKKKRYPKWVLTPIEITRHTAYLAAFTESVYRSYLTSGKDFVPISSGRHGSRKIIVGPIIPGLHTYTEHEQLTTTYRHAGGFAYSFEDNIVYKTDAPKLFPDQLSDLSIKAMESVNDLVVTKSVLMRKEVYDPEKWHPRVIDLVDYACRLKLLLPEEAARSGVASVLFQDCKTKAVVSPCRDYTKASDYFTIPRGYHNTIVIYNNGSYLKVDSLNLQSHTSIVADLKQNQLQNADSVSRIWLTSVMSNCFRSVHSIPARTLEFRNTRVNIGNVHGTILDETNMALPGATIAIKGTAHGTVSDLNGRFTLEVAEDPSILVVSFIGYVTREIEIRTGSEIAIVLEPDITQLQEVVVVGYGVSRDSRSLVYSVSTALSGKVSGVTIRKQNEKVEESEGEKNREEIEIREAEQKLYEELLTLKTIRSKFSDVGFWEPRLFTDRNGKAIFTVTFPDDITRWDAVVLGMNRQLQTGTARKSIKSYKPLMAELHVPNFLTVGDSTNFLGKVLNYSSDKAITGKTQWKASAPQEHDINFTNYHIDNIPVVVNSADTITASYSFTRNDGYFDGEERKVPVVEQGTIRANGTIAMLKNGDEIQLKADREKTVKLEIFDNQLDVYTRDIGYLLNYRYDCNEQLASKLIGLLNYKLLTQYEGKRFKHDKDVNKIIQRLLKNQNSEFLWSWWDVSSFTSYWMSSHILRALKAAKDAGYTVDLDLENVSRKATYKYDFLKQVSLHDVSVFHALALWNAPLDYEKYVKILDRHIQYSDSVSRARKARFRYNDYNSLLNDKLMLLEVRQIQNLPFVRDSLLQYKIETALNEVYFSDGQPARYWHSGDLSSNSIAYRIVRRDTVLRSLSIGMQMYFLSLRRKGEWNTYEASNVLMSILPDLIAQGSSRKSPASVSLTGKVNEQIVKFPYKTELNSNEQLIVRKETGLPLFCMQYTEERVTKAYSGTDDFKINTTFNEKSLKAGKPAVLKTTVEVKRDSKLEYVMIEIPIPAGCSYADKRQIHNSIETHREYFKEKTVIFCENMTPGTYIFQVQLLPRFTGSYHVNPAQVSLMYFPVVNANTDMEKIKITE